MAASKKRTQGTRKRTSRLSPKPAKARGTAGNSKPRHTKDVTLGEKETQIAIVMREPHIPEGEMVIEDPQVLEVLYEPTRHRIFRLVTKAPLAVRDLAEAMSTTANRLYHHVRLLERHGLIRVTDGRVVGNKIERLYAPAARSFRFAGELSETARLHSRAVGNERLREMLDEIAEAHAGLEEEDASGSQVLQLFGRTKLSKERAVEYSERVNDLFDEFFGEGASSEATDDALVYGTYAFLVPIPGSMLD